MEMKKIIVPLLLALCAQAEDFRISDEIYEEALREFQSQQATQGAAAPAASPAAVAPSISEEAQQWARCMKLMSSTSLEEVMKGRLALLSLIKKLNLFVDDAQLEALLATHEAALKGEAKASLQIGIALIKGEYGLLVFPCCAELALPYLQGLLDGQQ